MVSTSHRPVIVRAYDLGGFGDIAGAMRVASHLSRTGIDSKIKPVSASALQKLDLLKPDVAVQPMTGGRLQNGSVQVDVAGHYKDERNGASKDVPHHFTEDMDNPRDRRVVVPIYLKSGLVNVSSGVPITIPMAESAPMFYRPFREWELPKPSDRDARHQVIQLYDSKLSNKYWWNKMGWKGDVGRMIEGIDNIGFAHLSPQVLSYPAEVILDHPYFHAVHLAHLNTKSEFALGLFVNKDLESRLGNAGLKKHWNVVTSGGEIKRNNPDLPTLLFLGPQPQTTVTSLFLSSDMPNLVTGDLSLSNALYGLIAQEGPAFFYETPDWKVPTFVELQRMLSKVHPALANLYFLGSNYWGSKWMNQDSVKQNLPALQATFREVVTIFADPALRERYTQDMRTAVRDEIRRRFGDVQVIGRPSQDFAIPPGAPYLFQDATATVVRKLVEDETVFGETDEVRKMIANGTQVVVNVATNVLEPEKPKTKPFYYGYLEQIIESKPDYFEDNDFSDYSSGLINYLPGKKKKGKHSSLIYEGYGLNEDNNLISKGYKKLGNYGLLQEN